MRSHSPDLVIVKFFIYPYIDISFYTIMSIMKKKEIK